MPYYAIIRVRGRTGIKPEIKETMKMMSLTRINHCILAKDSPQVKGMLQVCKDYITWGEVTGEMLAKMIERRGRLSGNKRVSAAYLKQKGYDGFEALASNVLKDGVVLNDVGIKKIFRLHPPKGGYKITKQPFPHGALGYRGGKINDLLARMV